MDMEITLQEKIRAIFNSGNIVRIEKVARSKEGVTHYRYAWHIDGSQSANWYGFETIDGCVDDCITHLTVNSLINGKI